MSDSATPKKDLSALARSIQSLFNSGDDSPSEEGQDAQATSPAPAGAHLPGSDDGEISIGPSAGEIEDVAWVAETGGRFERDPDAPPSHDPLMRAVAVFLRAEGADRRSREPDLRDAFSEARSREAEQAMSEAIEALVRTGTRDPETLEFARDVLNLSTAKLFAARLTDAAGDERSRSDVHALIITMGPMMARALGKALDSEEDRSARRALIDAVIDMGDDANEVLERMVNDDRWFVVRNAVAILGQIGDETSVQHLTMTLANDDPRVRKETIVSLGRIGGENAGILLTGKLEDTEAAVRAAAARALGALKVGKALKPLLALLESENDEDAIIEVARALGQLGDPSAVNPLSKRALGSFFSKPSTPDPCCSVSGTGGDQHAGSSPASG